MYVLIPPKLVAVAMATVAYVIGLCCNMKRLSLLACK